MPLPPHTQQTPDDLMQSAIRLHQTGHLDQAETIYQRVLAANPHHADATHLLGVIACQQKNFQLGHDRISQAIALAPDRSEYYNSLGNALRGLKQIPQAIQALERACAIDPSNLAALNNLAVALDYDDQPHRSLECFERLITARSDIAPWHVNRGSAQVNAGLLPAAITSYRNAIALQPDLAGAHAKLAVALLSSGQFSEGWREYGWRFRAGVIADPTRDVASPIWDGTDPSGKTVLVQAEQGFGDFIQCVRYVPMIADQGATVVLRCRPELLALVQRMPGVSLAVSTDQPIPPHDLQVPIFSLPLLFATEEKTIPHRKPYLFADPEKASRYTATTSRRRIGLAWTGFAGHENNRRRSCPAELFNALADIDVVDFVRLQMPGSLPAPSGLDLVDHTADLKSFDDTAGLVASLDLVISVDTSVAHLAGAMGKPVWILLPFVAEWRWLTQREDSPWYPTARLFRQTSPGDWVHVLRQVRLELTTKVIPK